MNPELYEKHYEFEWNHRSYLSSAQNAPIAVMSIIGGALTVIIQKFPYVSCNWETTIFLIFISLSVLALLLAVIHFFRSNIGYEYERIATPQKLAKHYDELLEWWQKHGDGGKNEALADHNKYIYKKLAEATETNAKNNKNRSLFLHKTNFLLAVSFVFLASSSVPYLIKTINKEQKIYKIKLVESSLNIMEASGMADNEENTNQQKPQADPPPPKPEGPPNEFIKEDIQTPVIRNDNPKEE